MKTYHDMCNEISSNLRNYLLFFAIIFTVIVLAPDIFRLLSDPATLQAAFDRQETILNLTIVSIIPAAQLVVAVLASFFVNLETHLSLDKRTFKLKQLSDDLLVKAMAAKCQELKCEFADKIIRNPLETLRQYYHLVDKLKPDQSYLFDRWTRYYLNLYVLLFSVLIILASILLYLIVVPNDGLLVVSAIFLLVFILTLRSAFKHKAEVTELALMTPSRMMTWDDAEVNKHLLQVCRTPKAKCPWAVSTIETREMS